MIIQTIQDVQKNIKMRILFCRGFGLCVMIGSADSWIANIWTSYILCL